eukprot:2295562-Rhodomonas_salina.2
MKQKKHANQEVAALKAEMAALKDRMHEDAAMHERALTAAGREKEHAKTEGKEALRSLRAEIEAREAELEETKDRSKGKVRELQKEVKELEEAIAETRGLRKAAEEVARTQSAAITRLEKDLNAQQKLVLDREKQIQSLNDQILRMDEDMSAIEQDAQKKDEQVELCTFFLPFIKLEGLRRHLSQKEDLNRVLEDAVRQAEDNSRHETDMMSLQIEDSKRKMAGMVAEIPNYDGAMMRELVLGFLGGSQRTEEDARNMREQLREEIRRLEGENKRLRDEIQDDRDARDRSAKQHQTALEDLRRAKDRIEQTRTGHRTEEEELQDSLCRPVRADGAGEQAPTDVVGGGGG